MARFTLTRRTLLRGAYGAALALPPLEIMGRPGTAHAAPAKRYVVAFGGASIARTNTPIGNLVAPAAAGPINTPTRALQSLVALNALNEVSVVSSLKIPWGSATQIPPGGRPPTFHGCTLVPQVSGTKVTMRHPSSKGPTSDELVAEKIAAGTDHRVLAMRVQPAMYSGGGNLYNRGYMSWDKQLKPVAPIVSPRLAYETLFSDFATPGSADAAQLSLLVKRRQSILDLVGKRAEGLMPRLGQVDRERLQKHLEEVRALELRLGSAGGSMIGGCQALARPPADPPIGSNQPINEKGFTSFSPTAGYSGEDKRAELLTDFAHMALVCDRTRVVSMLYTLAQSYMNMVPIVGINANLHDVGHGQGTRAPEGTADIIGWHVKHFGRLVAKLRDTQEVDGSSLLDHSALVMVFEGGHGHDAESGASNSVHSSENMVAMIAGRAGGLKPGQHVIAKDKHPAQVLISAMAAVGLTTGRLGEVTGDIPALFGR